MLPHHTGKLPSMLFFERSLHRADSAMCEERTFQWHMDTTDTITVVAPFGHLGIVEVACNIDVLQFHNREEDLNM